MMDWEDVRHFLAVAQAGTLSGAARQLKVDHATVGRRLAALEAALGVRLVERMPRAVRLTETGRRVLEQAQAMEAGAHAIGRLARAAATPLAGRVTVSAPPVLVTHLLLRRLDRFRALHPDIRLSVSSAEQHVSLSRREADVAVRLVPPTDAGDVARKLAVMEFAFYAHRSYRHLDAPEAWQFIAFGPNYEARQQQQWLVAFAAGRPIVCEMNHASEHLVAARAGVGVAGLPSFVGDAEPELVRVGGAAAPFSREVWLLVHRDLRAAPAVRAVMDFLVDVIPKELA